MVHHKIHCVFNNDCIYCTNEKVQRSFFGLGPRLCVECFTERACEFKEVSPRPNVPPPSPEPSKKK